jgi:hypothetical protein
MVARRHDLFRSPAAVPAKLVPAKTTRTSALSMVQFQKAVGPRHGAIVGLPEDVIGNLPRYRNTVGYRLSIFDGGL